MTVALSALDYKLPHSVRGSALLAHKVRRNAM